MGPWTGAGGAAGGPGGGAAGGLGAGAWGRAVGTWAGVEEAVWIGTVDRDFLWGGAMLMEVWYEVLAVGWDIEALCFPFDMSGAGAGPLDTGGVGSKPGGCGEDQDRLGARLG